MAGLLPGDFGVSAHQVLQVNPVGSPGGILGGGGIRPAKENLSDLIDANFSFGGRVLGDRSVPINTLTGSGSPRPQRVKEIASQMNSPGGYIERPIVDDSGNIIEGQHRVEALRQLGVNQVPVTMIKDLAGNYNTDAMKAAVQATGKFHPDQQNQLVQRALESIDSEGSPSAAASNTSIGGIWEAPYQAALKAAQ